MNTWHNARRNARIERYDGMYVNQLIEYAKKHNEECEEKERRENRKQARFIQKQFTNGKRFKCKASYKKHLTGNIEPSDTSMKLCFCTKRYKYCGCENSVMLDKYKVREFINKLTRLHDHMTDPKPKDSD